MAERRRLLGRFRGRKGHLVLLAHVAALLLLQVWLRALRYRLTSGDSEAARKTLDRSLQVCEGGHARLHRRACWVRPASSSGNPWTADSWWISRLFLGATPLLHADSTWLHLWSLASVLLMQSLPRNDHVRMISQAGLLEFKLGDPGRSSLLPATGCVR
jgi:hypothetical protein